MDCRLIKQPYGLSDIVLPQLVYSPPKYHSPVMSQKQRSMLIGGYSTVDKTADQPSCLVTRNSEKEKKYEKHILTFLALSLVEDNPLYTIVEENSSSEHMEMSSMLKASLPTHTYKFEFIMPTSF